MDPQQELFTYLRLAIEDAGYRVEDSALPPDGTPYPFVYLAGSTQTDREHKGAASGTVSQTIHVWSSNPRNRGTVSSILLAIKTICRRLSHTDNFTWALSNVTQNILPDNTTAEPLLHGVLDVDFRFC